MLRRLQGRFPRVQSEGTGQRRLSLWEDLSHRQVAAFSRAQENAESLHQWRQLAPQLYYIRPSQLELSVDLGGDPGLWSQADAERCAKVYDRRRVELRHRGGIAETSRQPAAEEAERARRALCQQSST